MKETLGLSGEVSGMLPPAGHSLSPDFLRMPTLQVARALLGQHLCRRLPDGAVLKLPLTEVEAYDGPEDRASHASKGRTSRNSVMFGPAGYWYVYLCYGMHWMLNIVTGDPDYPAAVLIRGAGPHVGPGRLTKALAIGRELNEKPCSPDAGLWLESSGGLLEERRVAATPRIGVNYAGPDWASRPYRFVVVSVSSTRA